MSSSRTRAVCGAAFLVLIACAACGRAVVTADDRAPRAIPSGGDWMNFEKPPESKLREQLTPLQYQVTQEEGTEPPFSNDYWDNHADGIYVDVVSGEPLFSSKDKYESGTGWPSFSRPLDKDNIVEREDRKLWAVRTEVRSKHGDSHLGHVFDDGPQPTGLRYCMNSAALRFVPVDKMEAAGYGEYLSLFGREPEKAKMTEDSGRRETALLAGGCFWGVEELIRKLPGVVDTEVGYTGGTTDDATYEDVHTGRTGHAEAVKIVFDPERISYEDILLFFFRMHDPTTKNRQGNDVGTQYRSAIFTLSDQQRETAEKVRKLVDESGRWKRPVTTEIVAAGKFWPAEDYHQDYLEKHPGGYTCHYVRDFDFQPEKQEAAGG